jgi:hypothetical protein
MTFGLVVLIAGIGMVILFIILVGIIVAVVKNALARAADRVVDTATGIAGQAVNRAVDYGTQEAVKGAVNLGKSISEEMKRKDPKWVTVQINGIAHRNRGEVTKAQVISELSVTPEMAEAVLQDLTGKNVCFIKEHDTTSVKTYIFPGFKEKREIKFCEYCNSVYMPEDVKEECIHCGATLKHTTTIV